MTSYLETIEANDVDISPYVFRNVLNNIINYTQNPILNYPICLSIHHVFSKHLLHYMHF